MDARLPPIEQGPRHRPRARAALGWAALALATALLARAAIGGVLGKLGHPGAALDDAYIHFQYARALAEGHPLRFQAGEPISTGATSLLWPMLLAPFYALGARGEAILWPAWALSFAALGALAYEAHALTRPLAGRAAALGASAMVLAFGGLLWGAASGMEIVPFAWLLARAARRGGEWAEDPPGRTRRRLACLVTLAFACPLMRPEGAITSLALGVVVAAHPPRAGLVARGALARAEALLFVAGALAPNLLLLVLTGTPTSSTAQVKLLVGNPYHAMPDAALANARLLVGTLLDGEIWSAEFLPRGGAAIAIGGLVALGVRGWATKRVARAALVLVLALSMFAPCLYATFLWNRLRYLWPFATGWFIGLACLARLVGDAVARLDRRAGLTTTALLSGAVAGSLAVRLDGVLDDIAQSASGIDRQQVALGRWARSALPPEARIGVNDTGAIAYFGDRRTFDVVGLTTPTEGRYWVAGPASRLEHYERLHAARPGALPTHFIVYPEWMALDAVIGEPLHEATVTDSTILGGRTMRASLARWDRLGSGEHPWTPTGPILASVDVADLESEAAHAYELLGAREGEQEAREEEAPGGGVVLDGGRTSRLRDRFRVDLPRGEAARGIARVATGAHASLRVSVGGRRIAAIPVAPGPWSEVSFDVPAGACGPGTEIEIASDGAPFTSFHYWFAAPAR